MEVRWRPKSKEVTTWREWNTNRTLNLWESLHHFVKDPGPLFQRTTRKRVTAFKTEIYFFFIAPLPVTKYKQDLSQSAQVMSVQTRWIPSWKGRNKTRGLSPDTFYWKLTYTWGEAKINKNWLLKENTKQFPLYQRHRVEINLPAKWETLGQVNPRTSKSRGYKGFS